WVVRPSVVFRAPGPRLWVTPGHKPVKRDPTGSGPSAIRSFRHNGRRLQQFIIR
ncbi:hypothetical protein BaRGS_00004019, partial [Batillaria attramentaria]